MNNKIWWAVGAVVVLLGAWYLFSGSMSGNGGVSNVATTTTSTSTQQTGATSVPAHTTTAAKPTATTAKIVGISTVSYLFGLKEPLICGIKTTDSYKRSGTMYVADGELRANFVSTSMINDGKYLYAWTRGTTKGLQLLANSSVSGSAIARAGGFDPGTNISFSCNPWTKDASMFAVPVTVTFSNSL
ncbi:MAG: hypothetical protein ACHQU0_01455 [Candidatus Paceibacteria bacterium]